MIKLKILLISVLSIVCTMAQAQVVGDIKIDGLQRLSQGGIYNALNFSKGDDVDSSMISQAIRRLYSTGNFEDIKIGWDNTNLIVKVIERPMIASITIDGNSLIPTEGLEQGMNGVGLREGEILKRSTVSEIEAELASQYALQGRYNAEVNVLIVPKPHNRIDLKIDIYEGPSVKIDHIEIVGNNKFHDDELLEVLTQRSVSDNPLVQMFNSKSKFNRQLFRADLEALRSFYLNNGYLNFDVESHQIMLSEDKNFVTLIVNIDEGEIFYLDEVTVAGDLQGLDDSINNLVTYTKGWSYSQRQIDLNIQRIQSLLDRYGYYYSSVRHNTIVDEVTKQVDVVLFVETGPKTYVRRIEVQGNTTTLDEVVRREFRQLEGTIATRASINRSQARIQALGFFKSAQIIPKPVPGRQDLIDIVIKVEEMFIGNIQAQLAWQPGGDVEFGFQFSKDNFLGTGKSLKTDLTWSEGASSTSISYSDPYFTKTGGSRSINFDLSKKDYSNISAGSYGFNSVDFGLGWGYPISEFERLNFNASITNTDLYTNLPAVEIRNFVDLYDDNIKTFNLRASYSYSSVNGALLADDGMSQSLSFYSTVPGSDIEYFSLSYNGQKYFKFNSKYSLRAHSRLAYGQTYKDEDLFPFYKTFKAGGMSTVRGYNQNSLGPKTSLSTVSVDGITSTVGGTPLGGNILVKAGLELLIPTPLIDESSTRTSLFIDFGNVFNQDCVDGNTTCMTKVNFEELRGSYGASLTWQLGPFPLAFVYAFPINKQDGDQFRNFVFGLGGAY
ncbi:outer membrane protein assembly factor BamA [Marinicellulosiphila megalodicopiae]|uniref:outer membrane protein assembly factor BamA n=1 Tax=Marinicellulosiphila megalodicopiae TaxID=2724896 RepID=UPI003BB132CA